MLARIDPALNRTLTNRSGRVIVTTLALSEADFGDQLAAMQLLQESIGGQLSHADADVRFLPEQFGTFAQAAAAYQGAVARAGLGDGLGGVGLRGGRGEERGLRRRPPDARFSVRRDPDERVQRARELSGTRPGNQVRREAGLGPNEPFGDPDLAGPREARRAAVSSWGSTQFLSGSARARSPLN